MTLLHEKAPPGALMAVRAGVCVWWGLKLLFDPLQELAELPASSFDPPAPLGFFSERLYPYVLSAGTLLVFRFATAAVLLLAATGCWFVWLSPVGCILLTFYQSLVRGYGHINHNEIVPLLAVYVLTVFAWADRWEKEKRPAYPLMTIVFLLCLSYTFCGVHRIVCSGIGIFFSNAIHFWTAKSALRVTYWEFGLGRYILEYPLIGELQRVGFVLTTTAEMTALFCLVSRRFRIAFVLVMVPFHILSLVVMNIAFIENLLLLSLMVDTSRWRRETEKASWTLKEPYLATLRRSVDIAIK